MNPHLSGAIVEISSEWRKAAGLCRRSSRGTMSTSPLEDVRSAIDPPAGKPPAETGAALRSADAAVRSVLGLAWLALAQQAHPQLGASLLAICATLSLLGVAPRAIAAAGTLLAAGIAPATWSIAAALGLVALGLLRLRMHAGGAGPWLRDVRRLELRRAAALAATGFALAKHRSGDAAAITRAGDLYEREGRARTALAAIGAKPAVALAPVRRAAQSAGRALAGWPGLLGRIEAAASRWSVDD